MLDYSHLANQDRNAYVFYSNGNWQTWLKPKGCRFVHFMVIGSGGGGGAGGTGAIGTSRSGGAGGGSSGISRALISSAFLPDQLYIFVARGGVGGAPTAGTGGTGGAGALSYVTALQPITTQRNIIVLQSGNAAPGGGTGGAGAASSNATAGAASAVLTIGQAVLGMLGNFTLLIGQAGGPGGNINQSGTAIAIPSLTSGGAGGAGVSTTNRNGAVITGAGFVPTVNGGNATTLSAAESGYTSFNQGAANSATPLAFTGGAGGYSLNNGTGGNGGNGAFGSGGGGGGAGLTGGRGGNGGDGLIIITCW